jgi:hypothetical protein
MAETLSAPPSPCGAYEPFAAAPSPMKGAYAPFAPSPRGAVALADVDGEESKTPSPQGVFVSADEVQVLQQWAEDRGAMCERVEEAELLASQREDEIATLRLRLMASEEALKAVIGDRNQAVQTGDAGSNLEEPVSCRVDYIKRTHRERTASEVNALGAALSTRRSTHAAAKLRHEASQLREEMRSLRRRQASLSEDETGRM